ncbi:helix-turn-helix domain-containing protein [Aestuariibacter halophilus]|uniref:Helix-turn-helix domain-containing protein n=1 Tax=Fluctibacter halophilus TaxID=226011 RepID=A0ABS8GDJ1_9ALTE|nr:helix-turn-helix domain-containing protein [Aestuariibacter halophilus]MCC2617970.1 helix-turn-helix domain-containing protein [Aestuariibacter halophilus]
MENLNPYQSVVLALLGVWLITLALIWARFDRLVHGKYLLIAVLIWPGMLVDEWMRAFGVSTAWVFLAGLFQCLPALSAGLLLSCVNAMVQKSPRYSPALRYGPPLVILVGQFPLLFQTATARLDMLEHPPVGQLLEYWYVYGPHLLTGFIVLVMATRCVELFYQYHGQLSDQVVDVHLYRFHVAPGCFMGLMGVAFVAIILTTFATFGLLNVTFWQVVNNLFYAAAFLATLLVLLELRPFAPSPLPPEYRDTHVYAESVMRDTLNKAEHALIRDKAYKHIGLRLDQFAAAAKVDPIVLAQATRVLLKRNFRAFMYHYRLEYAKKILMRTDARVSTVARRLGFQSEKFLSQVFVKYIHHMGKPPAAVGQEEP